MNRVTLTELVPPVTVGVADVLEEAVVDSEDAAEEELDVTEAVVLSTEAGVDDEAALSVADGDTAVAAAVVLVSSCRGSGRAILAKLKLKHTNKQRRTPHVRGVGTTRMMSQTGRRCGTGALLAFSTVLCV